MQIPDAPNAFAVFSERIDPKGLSVVDIGAGSGANAARMAAAGANVLGIEPDPAKVNAARNAQGEVAGLSFAIGGAEAIPVDDKSVDLATCFNSFHHIPAPLRDRAVDELCRVLKPGGMAYIQEPMATGNYYEIMRLIDDEAAAYDHVQAVLDGAVAAGRLRQLEERQFRVRHRLASFDDMVARVIAVDERRRAVFEANGAAFAAAFTEFGRPDGDAVIFDQRYCLRILAT